jgi:hypothetical protein
MANLGGKEATHLDEFLSSMEYRPAHSPMEGGATITDLRQFVAHVNATWGGREG